MGIQSVFKHSVPSISVVIRSLLVGNAAGPYYYMVVLFTFTIITPFLITLVQSKAGRISVYSVSFALVLAAYALQFSGFNVWDNLKYTIVWLPYYFTGMLIRRGQIKTEFNKKKLLVMFVIAYVLQLAETVMWSRVNSMRPMMFSQIRITAYMYSMIIVCMIFSRFKINSNRITRFIESLGNKSFFIFLVHIGFISVSNRISVLETLPLAVHQLTQLSMAGIGSLLMYKIFSFLPSQLRKMLGA